MATPRIIRTNRPAPSAVAATAKLGQQAQARNIGRVSRPQRATSADAAIKAEATAELEASLQLIAKLDEKARSILAQIDEEKAKCGAALAKGKMLGYDNGMWSARLVDVISRAVRVVDPKLFFNKLKDRNDFWPCAKINIEQAKKFFVDEELNSISKLIPAVKTGTSLVVEPVKRKTIKVT